MANRTELDRHARRLEQLLAARDWEAIAAFDRQIAQYLRGLRPASTWGDAERAAFQRLRRIHDQVRERCQEDFARMGEQLTRMRTNKDAWIAYGLSHELDEAQT